MSSEQANGEVGYKRPPKETRWKKGQCGNPKRQYKRAGKSMARIIDEIFETRIAIAGNGLSGRVSIFEAIVLQLWSKATQGDKKAANIILEYLKFANGRRDKEEFILEFPQNEYTRRLAERMKARRTETPNA
jgi:hypothetical protein